MQGAWAAGMSCRMGHAAGNPVRQPCHLHPLCRLQYEFNMVMDLLRKGHPTADSKVRMLAGTKGLGVWQTPTHGVPVYHHSLGPASRVCIVPRRWGRGCGRSKSSGTQRWIRRATSCCGRTAARKTSATASASPSWCVCNPFDCRPHQHGPFNVLLHHHACSWSSAV
jgi:hypothetical protein